jgi:hypothetical protein
MRAVEAIGVDDWFPRVKRAGDAAVARRIIIDGIKIEGLEAKRIVHEVLYDLDEGGRARRRLPLGMILGVVVLPAVASATTSLVLKWVIGGVPTAWLILSCMVVAFVVAVAWVNLYLRLHRRQLREAMRRRGFELCTGCGYWLKGLGEDVEHCPECGRSRE